MHTSYSAANNSAQDRAARLATAIICIVVDALRRWLHGEAISLADTQGHVAAYLRDEIHNIERSVRDDIRIID